MSTVALQRVMTRMLFDPTFARAVYADAAGALQGVDLSDAERALLTRPDPRRWRADAERPHRALEALLAHLPVTLALRATLGGEARGLLDFFASGAFHEAIMSRALLSDSFAAWVAAAPPLRDAAWGAPLAALEAACAALRAAPLPAAALAPAPPPPLEALHPARPARLGARARLLWLPAGAVAHLEAARAALAGRGPLAALAPLDAHALGGEEALARLCAPRSARPPLCAVSVRGAAESAAEGAAEGAVEGVLIERGPDGVGVSALPPALAALLGRAAAGAALGQLLSAVEAAGVSAEGAREVVGGLAAEGLVALGD